MEDNMEYINEKLIELNNFIQKSKVAIIGLGVSNIPLLDYMHNLKANVTVFDDRKDAIKEFLTLNIYTGVYTKLVSAELCRKVKCDETKNISNRQTKDMKCLHPKTTKYC